MNQAIEDRIYLIVYVGDEKTFIDAPHGNRKHDKERNFIKTNKALLNLLKQRDAFPHTLYKQKISKQNSKLQSKIYLTREKPVQMDGKISFIQLIKKSQLIL